MISYYTLDELEKNCCELLHFTSGIITDSNDHSIRNSNRKIKEALRKIVIANELMEKGVICISGLQGAGKTSLLKNFYEIKGDFMNVSLGRGEKLPIFVSEKANCSEIELYSVCLDESLTKKHVRLSAEEFRLASLGNDLEHNTMYLEMNVPYKHFCNESYTLLLLPGFEKKHDYWQTLIDFAVKCSDTSIFVFTESSYAKSDNERMLTRIRESFGDTVIYAISHADESIDHNEAVKTEFMKNMSITNDDRVICVGDYSDSNLNYEWINALKNAINIYCNSAETIQGRCRDYIYEIIEDELRPEIGNIKEFLERSVNDSVFLELENSAYLKAFDKIVAKRRKQLDKQLTAEMKVSYDKSRNKLEKLFVDKKYAKEIGLKDRRIFQRSIFGENSKDIQFARERVMESMRDEKSGAYHYQYAFVNAVHSTSKNLIENNIYRDAFNVVEENVETELDLFAVETSANSDNALLDKQKMLVNDAALLVVKQRPDSTFYLQNTDIAETVKVIAEMGTQYFCLATINNVSNINSEIEIPEIEHLNFSPEKMKNTFDTVDTFILGALSIAGIDIMDDGILNAIPKLAEALGVSVPILNGAVVAIAGTTTGVAVIKDVNRLKRTEQVSAERAIKSIHGHAKHMYLEAYDESMQCIRDRIEENLLLLSGKNKKIFKATNANIAISKIEQQLDTIGREVSNRDYEIIRAFNG